MKKLLPVVLLMCLWSIVVAGPALAAPIVNGDFESGTLAGWRVKQGPGGAWMAYSGTPTVCAGTALAPADTGGALVDSGGPNVSILHQKITVPENPDPSFRVSLVLSLAYESEAAFEPKRDFNIDQPKKNPNHQFRIDLMKPKAPLTSVAKEDIVKKIFRTKAGDSETLSWTGLGKDVTALGGRTLRLRMVEASNQGCLNVMVDNVGYTAVI